MPNPCSTAHLSPSQKLHSQIQEVTEWSNHPEESKEGVYIIQGDALTGERIDCSQKGGQIAEESRGCLNIVPTAGLFHTQLAAYLAIYKASNVLGI
jgi:hypothetical protein